MWINKYHHHLFLNQTYIGNIKYLIFFLIWNFERRLRILQSLRASFLCVGGHFLKCGCLPSNTVYRTKKASFPLAGITGCLFSILACKLCKTVCILLRKQSLTSAPALCPRFRAEQQSLGAGRHTANGLCSSKLPPWGPLRTTSSVLREHRRVLDLIFLMPIGRSSTCQE